MWRRLRRSNIRVGGIVCPGKGAYSVTVPSVARKSSVRITGDVDSYLGYLGKVCAAIARATLDLETCLVAGIIRPAQIDLSGRNRCRREIAGRRQRWRRSRRWCGCGCGCWRRSWCWRWRRSWCWRWRWRWRRSWSWSWRRCRRATATRELERTNSRAPVKGTNPGWIIFVRVPESAIVNRVNSQITVITPPAAGCRLTAESGEKRGLALAQSVERICCQPPGVSNLRKDRAAGSTISDGDISLLIHCGAAHPTPVRIGLESTLLEYSDWSGGDIT